VFEQPASLADSRYRFDLLLTGVGLQIGNNYLYYRDLQQTDGDFETLVRRDTSDRPKALHAGLNFYLPSFMFKLNNGWAFGFTSRYRTLFSATRIGLPLAELALQGFDIPERWNRFYTNDGGAITFGNGIEFGLAVAAPVMDTKQHFLKAGGRATYTLGINGGYAQLPKADYLFYNDYAFSTLPNTEARIGHATNFEITGDSADNVILDFNPAFNLGVDIGVVYEWRPKTTAGFTYRMDGKNHIDPEANKYKLRVGVALTDLGWMALSSSLQYHVRTQVNDSLTQTHYWDTRGVDIDGVNTLDQNLLNRYVVLNREIGTMSLTLPTALSLQVDYQIAGPLYVALQTRTHIRLHPRGLTGLDWYSLSPRLDTRHFGLAVPLSLDGFGRFHLGVQLHIGAFMLGTNTLDVLWSEANAAQVNFGVRIPILHRKPRDRDRDQVSDRQDKCINQPGPWEARGCPDADLDSIPDKSDDCPDVPGTAARKGCPEPAPTLEPKPVVRDSVPTPQPIPADTGRVPVPTVPDTLPARPPVPAPADTLPASKPEPTPAEVIKQTEELRNLLKEAPQSIFFEFGSVTLTDSSTAWLDSVATMMRALPNRTFAIEGHTDNVGNPAYNQTLSRNRAAAVQNYLIAKGVEAQRLTAKGYGSTRPIVPNTTPDNRRRNRRVEIRLE
jgi:outer membrane protein OmpA-like peptidoglycan-associated protein